MSSIGSATSRSRGVWRAWSRALLIAVLVTIASFGSDPASADTPFDYGYTGGADPIRTPDGRDHWYCTDNFDLHHDWIASAMQQLDGQTVMYDVNAGSCATATDVVWVKTALDGILGGELVGETLCVTHVTWGVCDQFWVLIDQPQHFVAAFSEGGTDPTGWYSRNLQQTLRHELGHTAGLHHLTAEGGLNPAVGAMISAWIPNGTPGFLVYLAYAPFQVDLIDSHV